MHSWGESNRTYPQTRGGTYIRLSLYTYFCIKQSLSHSVCKQRALFHSFLFFFNDSSSLPAILQLHYRTTHSQEVLLHSPSIFPHNSFHSFYLQHWPELFWHITRSYGTCKSHTHMHPHTVPVVFLRRTVLML